MYCVPIEVKAEENLRARSLRAFCGFIWHLKQMIMKQLINCTKRWDVSAMRIQKWEFILLQTQMDIGWKLYHQENSKIE